LPQAARLERRPPLEARLERRPPLEAWLERRPSSAAEGVPPPLAEQAAQPASPAVEAEPPPLAVEAAPPPLAEQAAQPASPAVEAEPPPPAEQAALSSGMQRLIHRRMHVTLLLMPPRMVRMRMQETHQAAAVPLARPAARARFAAGEAAAGRTIGASPLGIPAPAD
jgi:hypothetical protein